MYIGQTKNTLEYRKNQHFREAKCNKRNRTYFHNALLKYGEVNFNFVQIEIVNTQLKADERERYWIKYYNSTNSKYGYNLDSGGKSGNRKSEETKKKIGLTTIDKWSNPDIAKRMKNGLKKGTETMKNNIQRFPFTCPVCNKTFYYPKHIVESKIFCSISCAAKSGSWINGVTASSIANHERNVQRKQIIKQDIEQWVLNNEDIVIKCPYNKITTTLEPLLNMVQEKYGIKDIRSLFICYPNINSRKTFLDKLKNIIYISKENVC